MQTTECVLDLCCNCVIEQQGQLIYAQASGTINFGDVEQRRIVDFCVKINETIGGMFIELMKEYYPEAERKWMKAELSLIDPAYYHQIGDAALQSYGRSSLKLLLDHWGENKDVMGKVHLRKVNRELCEEEYNDWKRYAKDEAVNCSGILDDYDRCLEFYRINCINYGSDYPQWFRLWRLILGNTNSSMSLERIFRTRKLYQTETCSIYSCEGLTHRLRLYYNSSKPSSIGSVTLYLLAWKYWMNKTQQRGRRHTPIAPNMQ